MYGLIHLWGSMYSSESISKERGLIFEFNAALNVTLGINFPQPYINLGIKGELSFTTSIV